MACGLWGVSGVVCGGRAESHTWPRKCDICSSTLSLKASSVSSSSSHFDMIGPSSIPCFDTPRIWRPSSSSFLSVPLTPSLFCRGMVVAVEVVVVVVVVVVVAVAAVAARHLDDLAPLLLRRPDLVDRLRPPRERLHRRRNEIVDLRLLRVAQPAHPVQQRVGEPLLLVVDRRLERCEVDGDAVDLLGRR